MTGLRELAAACVLCWALFPACRVVTESQQAAGTQEKKRIAADSFVIEGTMHRLEIEGGCWQLETSDNSHYEPVGPGLESIYVDGLKVELEVRTANGLNSTCQVGDLVQVLQIMKILN